MHALVHTQGIVLGRTYVPLELAYQDVLGVRAHFLITSPLNYSKMRKHYPHSRPDVLMVTNSGTPYSQVLDFLKMRQQCLTVSLSISPVFGYKGESYQPQILKDAGIQTRINVEKWGIPALQITDHMCRWHTGSHGKCAVASLNQILQHVP